jgi:NADPH:quinone reductase-like Zn-dependent oxidoreductase
MEQSDKMKAAVVETSGGPFRLMHIVRTSPGKGQVLVAIRNSGVNPLDAKIRAGVAAHARHPLPAVLGMDLSGIVVEVGGGVTAFAPGDEVFGMTGGVGGQQGSLAEYATVDALLLARKPPSLSMRAAAAVPLIFITAWEGLVDRAGIQPDQTVLVHGGAGGVGHMAVQLAVARGCKVFATDRAQKAGYLKSIGATPIDFEAENAETYTDRLTDGKGFDVVYDTGGGAVLDTSFNVVRKFGHVVSCLGWGTHALAPLSFKAASYSGVFTLLPLLTGEGRAHHGEILAEAAKLAEAGRLSPRVDPRSFDLETVEQAHDAVTGRTAAGKVVVDVSR